MIIEFLGLPGSGKTTTVSQLTSYLENYGYECVKPTRRSRLFRYLDYLKLDNIKLRILLFHYSKRYIQVLQFIYFSNWFLDYYNFYKKYQNIPDKTVVLAEQGLLQLLISIPFNQVIKDEYALMELLCYLRKKRITFSIVYCASEINTVIQRIRERGISTRRIDSMDEISMNKTIQVQEQNFSMLYDRINEVFNRVITVDSKDSLADKVQIIVESLDIEQSNR